MQTLRFQKIKQRKFWLPVVLLSLLTILSLSLTLTFDRNAYAANDKPYSDKSPSLNIFTNGGKVRWLYYGNIRLENKDGSKHWDYRLDPDKAIYELEDAGTCEEEDSNDRITFTPTGSVIREVILAPDEGKELDCKKTAKLSSGTPLNSERKDALFYQIKGSPETVYMWNSKATSAKFTTRAGSFPKWNKVFQNDETNKCKDILAQAKDGTWVFFPMALWDDVKNGYGFVEGAKSQDYASIAGDVTYEDCRVYSPKIINTYATGRKNRETLGPEQTFTVKLSDDQTLADDRPITLCGKSEGYNFGIFNDLPKYVDVDKAIEDKAKDDGVNLKKDWGDAPKLSDGYNWLMSCDRTTDGDWAYHTLKIWDTRSYGMTESSNRRLIDLSHVGLYSWQGGGGANNDGYKVEHGVVTVDASEVSDANPDTTADDPESSDPSGSEDEKTSCAVDGIGWIICPVMSFMAKMNDKAFGFLQNLLTVRPALITDDGTRSAWGTFRDIANVAFVIAFLVIVYSQLTSVGISNYGIKKLLPKIIVAAILVNLSYFICALLVDLSNIVGSSIYGLLANVVPANGGASGSGGAGPWETIVTVILAAAVGLLLFFVIFTSPFVLLALGIVLLILIARQAFVILLLVVSPLAFVAYLLPNTEDWFKKWWKAFTATLMVYPIVGAIFGASTLASNILMNVASGSSGDDETLLSIVALTVLAVPLFAVPGVLKSSLAAAGTIGAKIQGLADRAQGRATRDVGKRSSEIAKNLGNRASTSMLNGNGKFAKSASFLTGVRRRARRQDAYKNRQTLRDAAQDDYLNGKFTTDENGLVNPVLNKKGRIAAKSARLRGQAAAAQKTTEAGNKLITNSGALSSLSNNQALHASVAASNFAVHHQEETLKNKGETSYLNDSSNQEHYNDLIKSRENRQAAETNAGNRAKEDTDVRESIRENKVAKGKEKIVDNEIEIEHQSSDEGMKQGQKIRETEGNLEIVKGEQDVHFEKSTEGQTIAVAKDDIQQRKVIAQSANEQVAIEQNKGVRVDAAAATATLDAAKAGEKALLEELKTGAGVLANPSLATAAAALQAADTEAKLAANRSKAATDLTQQAFIESTEGRKSSLETQRAADNLAGAKATEEAIESELRAGGRDADGNLIQVDGLSDAEVEQFATDLSAADTAKRVQTQRSNAAKRVGDVAYAEAVKDDSTGLATTAGGIEGSAGVSQAKAVAQQTIIESFKKGVAAESTLLSSTNEDTILSDEMLGNADILDQPDEKIAAMGSVIAKRQHMTSHIKLWKRMAELRSQADAEVSAAEASGDPEAIATAKARKDKVVNLQQQVMGDKSKKPFGIGDADQGAATVGEYSNDIYKGTRDRILTHLSEASLSSMDPDDMRLIYEMARDGKLSPDHINKIKDTYTAWEGNPQLKHLLKDKTKALLDPIANNDFSADTETDPAKRHQFDLSGL